MIHIKTFYSKTQVYLMYLISQFLPDRIRKRHNWMLTKLDIEKDYTYKCQVRTTQIAIGVSSSIELFRCETYETKEPETLDWIDEFNEGDTLFDIGANIGVYSLYAAKTRGCRVYAFEPESHNFSRLVLNISRNDLQNVIPFCLAISECCLLDMLYVMSSVAGDSQHNLGADNFAYGRKHSFLQGVMTVSLDELCSRFSLPVPNHIKIDVDGIEEKIIKGGMEVLSNPQLKSVLVEVNQATDEANRITEYMRSAGLLWKKSSSREFKNENISAKNYFYARS